MKNRIFIFVLVCVVLLSSASAFVNVAGAAELPTTHTSSWLDYEPKVSDADKTVTYPNADVWAIGYKKTANDFAIFDEWASGGGLIRAGGTGEWQQGGFYANGTQGVDNVVIAAYYPVAYRYTAEYTGKVTVSVSELWLGSVSGNGNLAFNSDEASTAYAVAVNGTVIWPSGATYSDTSTWYYNPKVGANIAASIENIEVELNKGDTVEFLFVQVREKTAYSHGWFKPTVSYTEIAPEPEKPVLTSASIALNEKFAVNFFLDTDKLPANATEVGAYINEEFVAAHDGRITVGDIAAKNLVDFILIQPTYKIGSDEILGDESEYTAAELLMSYVTDDASDKASNLAIATLNYAAAAQTHFKYNTAVLANAGLTAEQKTVTYAGEYTKELALGGTENSAAKAHGATLLLGDSVALKFVYTTTDASFADRYELAVFSEGNIIARIAPTLCKGQTSSYKFILDGMMPSAWDADYTVAVVEKGGSTPIGESLTYGVLIYLCRMKNHETVGDICKAMLALYEAAVAYSA